MAVTHADLEKSKGTRDLGSKLGTTVIVLSMLCGLLGFVFCIIAEGTKTKVKGSDKSKAAWVMITTREGKMKMECVYTRDGKVPLLCGVGGFLTLAVGMIVQHAYMWLAVTKSFSPEGAWPLMVSDTHSSSMKLMRKQAVFFFLTAWVSFAVAEVLLVIGIVVESTHLRSWRIDRNNCLVIRHGSFIAAGLFDLVTVFLATTFYLVVLHMMREKEHEAFVRREVAEALSFSLSPQQSLSNEVTSLPANNNLDLQEPGREENLMFAKASGSG